MDLNKEEYPDVRLEGCWYDSPWEFQFTNFARDIAKEITILWFAQSGCLADEFWQEKMRPRYYQTLKEIAADADALWAKAWAIK